jgi:hypothetical protein
LSARLTRPSSKVKDMLRSHDNATTRPAVKPATRSTRGTSLETNSKAVEEGRKTRCTLEAEKATPEKVLELLGKVGGG